MAVQVVVPSHVDRERGLPALQSFARGLDHLGVDHRVVSTKEARPGPMTTLVMWSVYKWKFPQWTQVVGDLQDAQRAAGGRLVILERGFVRREDYYVVSLDDLNNRGRFPHAMGEVPPDRWEALGVELKPWRTDGRQALVVGQVPWDTSCQHVDQQRWAQEACDALAGGELEVLFRPHPLQPNAIRVEGYPVDRRPLGEALAEAGLVVTFSSTTGVDAVVEGVPTVAADPTSMVYGICSGEAGARTPAREPAREKWAHWLAYCQWTFEEMERGLPWLHAERGLP